MKNLPTICHFPLHSTVQSYRTQSPEFTGLKLKIKHSALSFFAGSMWIAGFFPGKQRYLSVSELSARVYLNKIVIKLEFQS